MEMTVTQVRLPGGLITKIDKLIDKGFYTNKSDVIRKLVLEKQIGSIPYTGGSAKEVREIRKKLPKENFNLNEQQSP